MTDAEKNLFLSILALDSYKQGYDEGITGFGGIAENDPERDAGFYAINNETEYGEVNSYCGTLKFGLGTVVS